MPVPIGQNVRPHGTPVGFKGKDDNNNAGTNAKIALAGTAVGAGGGYAAGRFTRLGEKPVISEKDFSGETVKKILSNLRQKAAKATGEGKKKYDKAHGELRNALKQFIETTTGKDAVKDKKLIDEARKQAAKALPNMKRPGMIAAISAGVGLIASGLVILAKNGITYHRTKPREIADSFGPG